MSNRLLVTLAAIVFILVLTPAWFFRKFWEAIQDNQPVQYTGTEALVNFILIWVLAIGAGLIMGYIVWKHLGLKQEYQIEDDDEPRHDDVEERVNKLKEEKEALERLVEYLANNEGRRPDELTSRELQVLQLVALGRSNKEIAGELTIATNTVARHINSIYGKTEVQGRVEAANYARDRGLL